MRDSALTRLERLAASLTPSVIAQTKSFARTHEAAGQPWFIAGVSDGMGLHTAIAAIESGALKTGVGVYWEPPHLLEFDDAGLPVSPIHRARVEHANALEEFARRRGVEFKTVFSNCILAPERDLKGQPKGSVSDMPAEILAALGRAEGNLIFINSVAFGKWMCPREGASASRAPMIGFDGTLDWASGKPYHARGYQETLDTMGRNHGWMLDALKEHGFLGPRSLSAFFTWAGGSQRVSSLEGIYGKGALGDAKMLAEAEVVRRRLDEDGALGVHAVVRLPAFLSAALMGIPGGGFFGMISRRVLETHGCFEGMPELASRMVREFFGSEWISENPISQIELDHAECLHLDEINDRVAEGTQRLEAMQEGLPVSAAQVSLRFADLFPDQHTRLLASMIPSEPTHVVEVELPIEALSEGLPDFVFEAVEITRPTFISVIMGSLDVSGNVTAKVSRFSDHVVVEAFSNGRWIASATGVSRVLGGRPEDLGTPIGNLKPGIQGLPAEIREAVARARSLTFEWLPRLPDQALMYVHSVGPTVAMTWVDSDAQTCGRVTLTA
jgi:hypothetical protein